MIPNLKLVAACLIAFALMLLAGFLAAHFYPDLKVTFAFIALAATQFVVLIVKGGYERPIATAVMAVMGMALVTFVASTIACSVQTVSDPWLMPLPFSGVVFVASAITIVGLHFAEKMQKRTGLASREGKG